MLRSIKRSMNRKQQTGVNNPIDLDAISRVVNNRRKLGFVYKPEKGVERSYISDYTLLLRYGEPPTLRFFYPVSHLPAASGILDRLTCFCFPNTPKPPTGKMKSVTHFTFGLNNDGQILFCICSHYYGSSGDLYCLCSVTSQPLMGTHYKMHQILVGVIRGNHYSIEGMDLSNLMPEMNYEGNLDFLTEINNPLRIENNWAISIDVEFPIAFYETAKNFALFSVQQKTNYEVAINDKTVIYVPGKEYSDNEIALATFETLFSCLSIENVVRYFRALIIEQRILVVSQNIPNLTDVVLSAIPLMSPLRIKAAILPILPNNPDFLEYIETPVPFVFGVTSLTNPPEGVTIIDLDHNQVIYPDETPHIPNAAGLRQSLKAIIAHTSRVPQKNSGTFWVGKERRCTDEEFRRKRKLKIGFSVEEIAAIRLVFTRYLQQFVDETRLQSCRVRDTTDEENPTVCFIREVYMLTVPPNEAYFFEQFTSTQAFQDYIELTYEA